MHGPDTDRTAERLRDRQVQPADQTAHDLANDEPQSVSAEHRHDRCCVKSPDDGPLQKKSECADDKGRSQHSEPDRQTRTVDDIGDIGAKQDELALGEVEDAHHAGDDPEPQHDQDDDRAETQDLEQCDEQIIHSVSPAPLSPNHPLPRSAARLHLLPVAGLFEGMRRAIDGHFIEMPADQHQRRQASPSTMPQGTDIAGWCVISNGAVLLIISNAR